MPGRCDAFTTDASGLYAERLRLNNPGRPHGAARDHLEGAARPGGPPGRRPMVRHHRAGSHYALLTAEELGVTQANVDEMLKSDKPDIKRLLGAEGDFGKQLGLDNDWAYNIIKARRQLRRDLRAQRRRRLAPEDRARRQRACGPRRACNTRRRSADRQRLPGGVDRRPAHREGWPMTIATHRDEPAARQRSVPLQSAGPEDRLPGRRSASIVVFLIYSAATNAIDRLAQLHIASGFGFLGRAGRLRHQPAADRVHLAELDQLRRASSSAF